MVREILKSCFPEREKENHEVVVGLWDKQNAQSCVFLQKHLTFFLSHHTGYACEMVAVVKLLF